MLLRELGLLAIYLYKNDADGVSRVVDDILKQLPEDARREVESDLEAIKEHSREGRWDEAWDVYQVLTDKLGRLDPVLSAYVPRETYEAYQRAARPEETVSSYARRVLEGMRSPAVPPDGVVAARRVREQVRAAGMADWEERLGEYSKPPRKVDWEERIEEITKPIEVEWEKRLDEYLGGGSTSESSSGSESEERSEESASSSTAATKEAEDGEVEEGGELPEEFEAIH